MADSILHSPPGSFLTLDSDPRHMLRKRTYPLLVTPQRQPMAASDQKCRMLPGTCGQKVSVLYKTLTAPTAGEAGRQAGRLDPQAKCLLS